MLKKYSGTEKVIVACHGMVIQALTGGIHPGYGELTHYALPEIRGPGKVAIDFSGLGRYDKRKTE